MTDSPPRHPVGTAESRWLALAGAAPFVLATFSRSGRLTFLNRAPGGRRVDDLVGRTPLQIFQPESGTQLRDAVAAAIATGQSSEFDFPAVFRDGFRQWFHLLLTPVEEAGERIGVLAIGVDRSDSHQIEAELRMSVNALHRLIEDREQLAADLHDEILQALFGVGLRLEAARSSLEPDDDGEGHLSRAIGQLNDTIRDIRGFLAGRSGAAPATVCLEEALAGTLHGLQVEGGPAIRMEIDPDAAARLTPAQQTAILPLAREAVSNAIRHAQASRIRVELLAQGAEVCFLVEDDGRGMVTGSGRGFGLLNMTRRAGQIGGILSIQSEPGAGTTVRLKLSVGGE